MITAHQKKEQLLYDNDFEYMGENKWTHKTGKNIGETLLALVSFNKLKQWIDEGLKEYSGDYFYSKI